MGGVKIWKALVVSNIYLCYLFINFCIDLKMLKNFLIGLMLVFLDNGQVPLKESYWDDIEISAININEAKIKTKQMSGKAVTGSHCEFIRLCNIMDTPGCEVGSKFILRKKDGLRKQFLILNGFPILAFVTNGLKFANCSSFTEITTNVVCKKVPGASTISLDLIREISGRDALFWDVGEEWEQMLEESIEVPIMMGNLTSQSSLQGKSLDKSYKGNACEYVSLCEMPAVSGCDNATKFVLKRNDRNATIKQFLIIDETPIFAFVPKGETISNCTTLTPVTESLNCKAVPSAVDIELHYSERGIDESLTTEMATEGETSTEVETTEDADMTSLSN